MKALPKLMKNGNSVVTIEIVSEEMPTVSIQMHGATSWPSIGRLDPQDRVLRFFDLEGATVHEEPSVSNDLLPNFALIFMGVTESTVDFKTKSQFIAAKMRAIDLDTHENVHTDTGFYEE